MSEGNCTGQPDDISEAKYQTKEMLVADALDGIEYPCRDIKERIEGAKEEGIVVLIGYSDDGAAFYGAIYDLAYLYGGGEILLDKDGLYKSKCDDESCPHEEVRKDQCKVIKAIWGQNDCSWSYETSIPHEKFKVMEGDEIYCYGIVFNMQSVDPNYGAEPLNLVKMTSEKEMRESVVPWPRTSEQLIKYLNFLAEHNNDYGMAVYCMSMGALAAFYYMSHIVGATGFQASCADMDFLKRSRRMKDGFRILDYEKLLYPQHINSEEFPSADDLLKDQDLVNRLGKIAKQRLDELSGPDAAHPNVIAHWEKLASMVKEEDKEPETA